MKQAKMHKRKFKIIRRRIILAIVLITCFVGVHLVTSRGEENKKLMTTIANNKVLSGTNVDDTSLDDDTNKPDVTDLNDKYGFDSTEVRDALIKGQVKVDGKKIAFLTFDDGPSTTVTPKILEVLNDNNVHATFFVTGQAVNKGTEEILKEELKQGHSIGNHTYSHNYDYLYPGRVVNVDNFMNEINKTNEILKNVLGDDFHTRILRMPGGHMSWPKGISALDDVFNENDYVYIDWNCYTQDAEGHPKNKQQLLDVLKKYYSGNDRLVILMHDSYGKESTAEALPEVINFLKEQGYEFKVLK